MPKIAYLILLLVGVLTAMLSATAAPAAEDAQAAVDQFEREVRPILVEHCQECHGAKKQESDLRLDSRAAALQGGLTGPALVPGEPKTSLLLAAIRHEGDLQMPPKKKLADAQIAAITRWIEGGAPWPSDQPSTNTDDRGRNHWAFQPVRDPHVPKVPGSNGEQPANPIDAFIRAALAENGLQQSPPADRRTLIRRATYDLHGLPPTPEEVAMFERDSQPQAFTLLVERLLSEPQYGEQWGRHWLDVARYSDTKGYVYAREQRFWPHAWVYRDWVVRALNDDLPYNRFLLLQIAADQAAPQDKGALAAMGFLTLGRRFLGVQRDIIDDRIDVVTRGTMGLTVGCARCHDHKYDPIPTADYYSLYGIFQSCTERLVPLGEPATPDAAGQQYLAELEKRRKALAEGMAARRLEVANRNRARVGDYLAAQLELSKYPEEGFDVIIAKTDLLGNFVRRWQAFLADAKKSNDSIFAAWHAYAAIPPAEFAALSPAVTKGLGERSGGEIHPLVAAKFAASPAAMTEVAARYGELFAEIEQQWQAALKAAADQQQAAPTALADAAAEGLRQVLYSPHGPCEVPDETLVNIEYYFDSDSLAQLWKLQNEYENWVLQSPPAAQHAIVLNDRDRPVTPRIFRRGNPANKGDEVPRQFVQVVAGNDRQPFSTGSGRLELAQAIIDPANPLTARVIVNRVWTHHFGLGLVPTPSDFGTRADPPSHPELLDWLTSRFIEDGWSLKKLHRRIMLSQTYQQSSRGSADEGELAKANQLDPQNRLLWRINERRLTFEEMRDSLLAAAGKLDRTVGGRAGDLFTPGFTRRTLYGSIDRQFLPTTLRVFDFANPDLHIPLRSDTTVPQQALFFLNHPLMVGYAKELSQRTADAGPPEARVQRMYELAYQRPPTPAQLQAALEFVASAEQPMNAPASTTALAWQYGYGAFDEKTQRVTGFEKLPHFTGTAWQGGPAFPDGKLGWVQLTAAGGHPGNDLAHAAVRRWTAPADMQVRIQSTLVHEPAEGQGVRGFIVSSRDGLLKQASVHHGQAELHVESLAVKAGDTLDFVADIGSQLSYNQFLWSIQIAAADRADLLYDSARDFQGQPASHLTAWEQLAQVLLSANEFVFVD